ncbi:MAG: DUF177 domain-containing protein [Nitrospiraceae bacterium]|nr:DUF177 domain-containing protein [Nitrospiraceae bacterium]
MKILIADIPEEGLIVDLHERLTTDDGSVIAPVVSHLDLQKMGTEVMIRGSLRTEVSLECSRCLQPFRRNMDIPVNVVYHPLEEVAGEGIPVRHALNADEMDMGFYREGEIDLQELLREQIVLDAQMKPLCDDKCKGICPKCGTDLNKGTCTCSRESVDPRLEVLKQYFQKRKE